MFKLTGSIQAKAPITVSYPDTDGLPRTPHGEVTLFGGTFRGPLRKAALAHIRRALAEHRGVAESEIFTVRDIYMQGQGVDTTREVNNESKDKTDPVGMAMLRAANPLLSAFGRWRLPGHVSVGNMKAAESSIMTVGKGARADHFDRSADEVEFLDADQQALLMQQIDSAKNAQRQIDELTAEQRKLVREGAKATKAGDSAESKKHYQAAEAIDEKIKQAKSERVGPEEAIRHPLAGYEAISAGTSLDHWMSARDTNSLAVLLAGLAELSREPFLGGHRSAGCGMFTGRWSVQEFPKGSYQPVTLGEVEINDGFSIEGDAIQAILDDFLAKIGEFDFTCHTLAQARAR